MTRASTNCAEAMEAGLLRPPGIIIPTPITLPPGCPHGDQPGSGSLGVYGFRNQVDHSYDGLGIVNSRRLASGDLG